MVTPPIVPHLDSDSEYDSEEEEQEKLGMTVQHPVQTTRSDGVDAVLSVLRSLLLLDPPGRGRAGSGRR